MSESGKAQDRTLTCVDCGNEFTWSAGEQAFFQEKGLTSEPKRCLACRRARKNTRDRVRQKGGDEG